MKHEIFDKSLMISDTDITFEKIYDKEYFPKENIEEIKKANLLIIPNENFRKEGDVLFPETTYEFWDFIRDNKENDMIVDIAVSDDKFQRIELHSAAIEVATIIVESFFFDIAVGLISSYLYDLIKKYRRKPEETSAKVKIITEETKNKKSKCIIYEGPVSGIKETLEQAGKDLFSQENHNDD